jgi:hypothetical protein
MTTASHTGRPPELELPDLPEPTAAAAEPVGGSGAPIHDGLGWTTAAVSGLWNVRANDVGPPTWIGTADPPTNPVYSAPVVAVGAMVTVPAEVEAGTVKT